MIRWIWEKRYCRWCGKVAEFATTDSSDMCNSCKGA